ncbi:MAG: putative isomerase [Flavobacteriales bacterium]
MRKSKSISYSLILYSLTPRPMYFQAPISKMHFHFQVSKLVFLCSILLGLVACEQEPITELNKPAELQANILDYTANPTASEDRNPLAFSDQGAWFAYGFSTKKENFGGFSGPFIMTQENGKWCSPILSQLFLIDSVSQEPLNWIDFNVQQRSYPSHLEQVFSNANIEVLQSLFFYSGHTALIHTNIRNKSDEKLTFVPMWKGAHWMDNLHFNEEFSRIELNSDVCEAQGYILPFGQMAQDIQFTDSTYQFSLDSFSLEPGKSHELVLSHQFVFPEYAQQADDEERSFMALDFEKELTLRIAEKQNELHHLAEQMDSTWNHPDYQNVVAKAALTLQNNWRVPAGELKHEGLFPSYHYVWFHGFWAWDSWKHAAALARYKTELAKEQVRAMYDFMDEDGFIADCVYRDTTIEAHNYRNTKPPLSAWAVWEIFQADGDTVFIKEMYDKMILQHNWWYKFRDHDGDSICEYGSADGTLIAAKWESGMDNGVRFDHSRIVENFSGAFSLTQESVDLNSFLFAEKNHLTKIAGVLDEVEDQKQFKRQAQMLQLEIQRQFFDETTGWFYDTSLNGDTLIRVMGCEGWTALWANAASQEQAIRVVENMRDESKFNTKVPFPTMSISHPDFKPDGGYWRGPNWLDQVYFGIQGLRNYGYNEEANQAIRKVLNNCEGLMEKGPSIRENYHPITGAGLESENFSWSAAHLILMLTDE